MWGLSVSVVVDVCIVGVEKMPAKETRSIEQLKQLSIKEVVSLLGYSYSTVHRMIERGELASVCRW
jgi:IS30 family transposase